MTDMTKISDREVDWMAKALALAEEGGRAASPNPMVGCLLVKDGRVIGEGHHRAAGSPHAEIEAIEDARRRGEDIAGATVYVTLEPCVHWGRTAPCADALIAMGVSRVVAAMADPDPRVAGRGIERLRAAGVEVVLGPCGEEARRLNCGFLSRIERGRPWVRLKMAASIDGKTALGNGISQWITGEKARWDNQHYRAMSDAVVTGIGTVLADDPKLTVREVAVDAQPLRIVVDSRFRLPLDCAMIDGNPIVVAVCHDDDVKRKALAERAVEVAVLPGVDGKVDLEKLLTWLGNRQINIIHVEAGARLSGALIEGGLVDEALLYFSGKVMGSSARPMFILPAAETLEGLTRLRFESATMIGDDIRVSGIFV